MKAKEYEKFLTELTESIKEGVHIIDKEGNTIMYNTVMSELEQQRRGDVLGKPFREVFSNISLEESTLSRALLKNIPTKESLQTYSNKYGQKITTLNTTKPVMIEGKLIGAVEVAENITRIKTMSDTIHNLRHDSVFSKPHQSVKSMNRDGAVINRYTFDDLIGINRDFLKQVKIAQRAVNSRSTVFIYGETGTGKELFAQSIHFGGERKKEPFLAQNCAALPATLLEGILFGTSKGGFTGAEDREGLFEQASGGTLLLDELSAMPYGLQSKLLRVLQEGYVRRLGGNRNIAVDTRIIATVNEKPADLIEKKLLRKDLYYRLNILGINIPPLRKRKEDIPILAESLLKKQCRVAGVNIVGFTDIALEKLQNYDYPGNVRELENIIISAIFMADEKQFLDEEDIVISDVKKERTPIHGNFKLGGENMDEYLFKIEKSILIEALESQRWNISKAAELLGLKRQTLQHKIKKFKLESE